MATKLKLKNARYVVVKRLSSVRYLVKHLYTGKEKVAHIDQIARMRLHEVSEPERPANVAAAGTVDACWKKLKPGKFALFWIRNNDAAHLTVMEIVNVNEKELEFMGWYYCHRVRCAKYQHDRPLTQMRYAPEWCDQRGQSGLLLRKRNRRS